MYCLVAVINGFVLLSTGMRITAFGFCVPVNMVCAMSLGDCVLSESVLSGRASELMMAPA